MKEEKFIIHEKDRTTEALEALYKGIYTRSDIKELQESALLMDEWSKCDCFAKCVGGMEEWAKSEGGCKPLMSSTAIGITARGSICGC